MNNMFLIVYAVLIILDLIMLSDRSCHEDLILRKHYNKIYQRASDDCAAIIVIAMMLFA